MKISERLIQELSNEVVRLENQIDDFIAREKLYKSKLEDSNTNASLYRENLLEVQNKNKELLDFITDALANVNEPVSKGPIFIRRAKRVR